MTFSNSEKFNKLICILHPYSIKFQLEQQIIAIFGGRLDTTEFCFPLVAFSRTYGLGF